MKSTGEEAVMEIQQNYALVFVTARWCEPAVPMRIIFDELVQDLERRIVKDRHRGGEVSSISNIHHVSSTPDASGTWNISDACETFNMGDALVRSNPPNFADLSYFPNVTAIRGIIVDIDEVEAILASRADDAAFGRLCDPALELDPLLTPAFVESIDFIPTIILMRDGNGRKNGRVVCEGNRDISKTEADKCSIDALPSHRGIRTAQNILPTTDADPSTLLTDDEDTLRSCAAPRESYELTRFLGQLPKLYIRERIIEALDGDSLSSRRSNSSDTSAAQ